MVPALMALEIGIVGLPNAGKSTIFNALTANEVPAEAFPFCTIDPSTGVVAVPDPRLEKICEYIQPKKVIPTAVTFVDIAGLVKNASQGEGLGNKFLSHIRQVDAIAHVVRCFDDDNVAHVHGTIDPKDDIDVINTELALADLDSVTKRLEKEKKATKSGDKEAIRRADLLSECLAVLEDGKPIRSLTNYSSENKNFLSKELGLLTAKPILYVANITEGGEEHPRVRQVQEIAATEGAQVITLCGKLEAEISKLEDAEKKEYLEAMDLKEPALNRLIRTGFSLLNLISFFTAGEKEVRAWEIRKETLAPEAAGKIHSDIERGFIRAEIYHYNDLVELKSEANLKAHGKIRQEGKEYVVQDGDVIFFKFNV